MFEQAMTAKAHADVAAVLDAYDFSPHWGRERTEAQYRSLFGEAGIDFVQTVPTATPFSIVEGRVR